MAEPKCSGLSAFGPCERKPKFEIQCGRLTRHACGVHVGWQADRITVPGRSCTVTKIGGPE